MNHYFTKIILGVLLWALVYFASLPMLPLIKSDVYFFKTLIGFVFTVLTVLFAAIYFARTKSNYLYEGISIGILWMCISLLIDVPIFIYKDGMSFSGYFKDIGLTYVAIPVITIATGYLLENKKTVPAG